MPLLVVRHANAGRRSAYKGDDRLRPLSTRGQARAAALVPLLSRYQPESILSSPFVRCVETVTPVAEALDLRVRSVDALAEGHGVDAVPLLRRMAGKAALLCTHGDVAVAILEALVPDPSAALRSDLRLQKGEVWVIESDNDQLTIVEHIRRVHGGSGSPK
jgi:8-oxo-(d)GTP phosphatase